MSKDPVMFGVNGFPEIKYNYKLKYQFNAHSNIPFQKYIFEM